MKNTIETMRKIINSCDILLNDMIISKERLLQEYTDFLATIVFDNEHHVGFSLHTGSICFDAITLIFAALSNWVENTMTPEEVVHSLEPGDIVIYGNKKESRFIFKGIVEIDGTPYVSLESHRQSRGKKMVDKTLASPKTWSQITPYYGESTCMDGRGIRSHTSKHKDFLSKVLDVPQNQIPNITDTSTVIVMSRERASLLLNGIQIRYDGSNLISLLELATASYFTEQDEYPYGGNQGKNEPILKISGKVSVARNLIVKKDENKIIGLCVLGNDFLISGKTELTSLINRKSLGYVLISTHIDSEDIPQFIEEADSSSLFACTKDFLLEHSLPTVISSSLTNELEQQVACIVDYEVKPKILNTDYSWEQYKHAKQQLSIIKNSQLGGEEKEYFVIQSHTLMKLFVTAAFPISYMEDKIADKTIDVESPQSRLTKLIEIACTFPESLYERAAEVIDLLENLHLHVLDHNVKENYIRGIVLSGRYKRIAIVVAKAFYRNMLSSRTWMQDATKNTDITIVTANKFDNSQLYDCIIVAGLLEGKKFNTFKCKSAPTIIPVIYDFEEALYAYKSKSALDTERKYNQLSYVPVEVTEDVHEEAIIITDDIIATSTEESQLDNYIKKMNELALIRNLSGYHQTSGDGTSEIVLIVKFDNGQGAFFSKAYRPYVFDDVSQSVVETELTNLAPGDRVVFTQNNDETKDIVDAVLKDLINSNTLSQELHDAYAKSKYWKLVLRKYVKETGISYNELSRLFERSGVSKGAGAIRDWLDPDSHTVGPKDWQSFQVIGKITGNSNLLSDPRAFRDACSTIRTIRRRILAQIELAIIDSFSGTKRIGDDLFNAVSEKIDSLSQILRVKTVVDIEGHTVPSPMANKPLNLKE